MLLLALLACSDYTLATTASQEHATAALEVSLPVDTGEPATDTSDTAAPACDVGTLTTRMDGDVRTWTGWGGVGYALTGTGWACEASTTDPAVRVVVEVDGEPVALPVYVQDEAVVRVWVDETPADDVWACLDAACVLLEVAP